MKRITLFKSLAFLVMCLCVIPFGFGQTILTAGDIAITGFNSDNPDQFSFVLLTDVTNSTTINFTDNGWLSTSSFRAGEGTITWTATSDLPCGIEIIITDNSPFSASIGNVTDSPSFQLSTSGDQILAYQGLASSPTFIFAVNFEGVGWSDATNSNDTALPTGLTDGINALDVGETDNGIYDCSVTSNFSAVLTATSTNTNWNISGSILTIGSCFYSCTTCSGGIVTWDGAWSGTPDLTTQVIIDADYNTGNGGSEISFSACSLKVNNGFTLNIADNTYIEVQNDITVDPGTGSSIVVQPNGSVVQVDDSASVTVTNNGTITVTKRTAPANAWYEYTYWSSPVSGADIANGLTEAQVDRRFVFDAQSFLDAETETNNDNVPIPGYDDIDDNGDAWQSVSSSTIMTPGVGYASTHDRLIFNSSPASQFIYDFVGPFNNGIITVPIYRNDSESGDKNLNFIGNPYPSAISVNSFFAANSDIDGAIYIWSHNTPPSAVANGNEQINFSDLDYAVINGLTETQGGDPITPNRFIPSGQGFFVTYSDAAIPISTTGDISQGQVVFNNSMRMADGTSNSQFFKNSDTKKDNPTSVNNILWIDLTSSLGAFNQIAIGYADGATDGDDGLYYDATKTISYMTTSAIYSLISDTNVNKKFTIQGKDVTSLTTDEIIPLGFYTSKPSDTEYKFSMPKYQGEFLSNNTVYLKDNLLNKLHDLSASDYTFTSEIGEFNDRFEIVFNVTALSTNDDLLAENTLNIITLNNGYVRFSTSNNLSIKTVTVYDALGRALYNFKGQNSSETYRLSNLGSSIYIAEVTLSNGVVVTKKAIKK
ncbi:T9SS type A sorting domain-containing protein [Flavivirga eckloniae]|uniref:Secretion system C-terminal sorting domain-containing protein n=1 Tax=Flavivirga eckloniae TaxID=1803846 RepID=A0A2K9PQ66_9FLAO|nr:T9SS type A sorting domain-containing protein [Flavivirga eckloniae]AUP79185.1 hypothetical protein C1H87_10910 [Flavivirga eckloniae]